MAHHYSFLVRIDAQRMVTENRSRAGGEQVASTFLFEHLNAEN